ncbi:MAG: hypothetical protein JST80_07515 [Bdellovibrionales bacterium]|nr:hypothetical protein [Bdellovibrionales bacterium]
MTKQEDQDSRDKEEQYRQFGYLYVIIAELIVSPSAVGGLVYFLTRGNSLQLLFTILGVLAGMGIAFYRIFQFSKRREMK